MDDAIKDESGPDFEVWRENWETVIVFLACSTCWRKEIPAMSGALLYHGLNYQDVDVVIRHHGHRGKRASEIFLGVQTMEMAALPILNKAA